MEDKFRGYRRLTEMLRDKDIEIKQLRREKRGHMVEIQELNAKLISIQKLAIPTRSSSPEKKGPTTMSVAKNSTALQSPSEKRQQPTSVLADLPARPIFTGFEFPQTNTFTPTSSPRMIPPRPTPFTAAIESASESTIPSTRPVSVFAKSPTLPSPPEKKQQPTSLLADLPARPIFTGFDDPQIKGSDSVNAPAQDSPTASPPMLPPRPTPLSAAIEPAIEFPTFSRLPARPARRPKGTVPHLLPYHRSFGASQTKMPDSIPAPHSQDNNPLFPIPSPLEIQQQCGGASSQETVDGESNHPSDKEKEGNEWSVARQIDGNPRWL